MAGMCARHRRPGRLVRFYPDRHAEAEWVSACVLCAADFWRTYEILDWVGSTITVEAAWASWRHEFRKTVVPGFDPDDVLWREIESTAVGGLRPLGSHDRVARCWAFMATTGLTGAADVVELLVRVEFLLGRRAFERDERSLRQTYAESSARWTDWFSAVWDRLDETTRASVLRVGRFGPPDDDGWPQLEEWMSRLDSLPADALQRQRAAEREVESLPLPRPTAADCAAWTGYALGDDREAAVLSLVAWAEGTVPLQGADGDAAVRALPRSEPGDLTSSP